DGPAVMAGESLARRSSVQEMRRPLRRNGKGRPRILRGRPSTAVQRRIGVQPPVLLVGSVVGVVVTVAPPSATMAGVLWAVTEFFMHAAATPGARVAAAKAAASVRAPSLVMSLLPPI